MEAASIPWRPLGRLLVEQGLLTADELEHALAEQERTGRRLGETLVECGFVSGPELSNALAAQYGIELTAETGFGTGLRTVIQQRHESDRGRVVRALPSADEPFEALAEAASHQEPAELEATPPEEQILHAQLEEQWAKLAAAEERLAESHRELTALAHEYDERRSQAARLARRARQARAQPDSDHEQDERIAQLEDEVRARGAEIDRLRSECWALRDELAGVEAATEERIVESHRELAALAREYDRRHGQASRLAQRARLAREGLGSQRERDEQIVRLEENVRARDAEIDRLREVLAGVERRADRDERITRLGGALAADDATRPAPRSARRREAAQPSATSRSHDSRRRPRRDAEIERLATCSPARKRPSRARPLLGQRREASRRRAQAPAPERSGLRGAAGRQADDSRAAARREPARARLAAGAQTVPGCAVHRARPRA